MNSDSLIFALKFRGHAMKRHRQIGADAAIYPGCQDHVFVMT